METSYTFITAVAENKAVGGIRVSALQRHEDGSSQGAGSLVGVGSSGDERLWQKYFENPTNWWDNRNYKRHPRSPDFRLKGSKEALWINSWSTPQWVMEALKRMPSSKPATEGSCQRGNSSVDTVVSCSPPLDQFSWTTLISQHAKRGHGRKALRLYKEMQESGVKPSSYTFVAALKACSSLQDLESAQQIHADVIRSGCESVVYVGTMLLDVYMKCGSLMDAREVFEKMADRDVVCWNAMILGYAQMGEGERALQLYSRMQQEQVVPNDRTFVAALKACSSLAAIAEVNEGDVRLVKEQCLEQVRAIHSQILKSIESDAFVGTMLADVYAKCGSLADARDVFEKMPRHDVTSWNSMILGYAQMERGEEALHLFARMQQDGVVPDERTFVSALRACSSLVGKSEYSEGNQMLLQDKCLEHVRTIHSSVVKQGFESRVFVGNILVDAYAKCGSLVDARHVFEMMAHRSVVSWNAIISGYAQVEKGEEALQLYRRMQQEGVAPNCRTFIGALKACTSLASPGQLAEAHEILAVQKRGLEQVLAIHSNIVRSGCESDVYVGTMLVDAYAKCGSLLKARDIFERLPHRNVVSWTAMILGYAQMEQGEEALALYDRMELDGTIPNHRTFVAALKACGSVAGLEKGKEIHAQLSKTGLVGTDPFVVSALIDMYASCGSMGDAQHVFDALATRNTVTWNALIAGYAHQGQSGPVFDLFLKMRQEGKQPNGITFLGMLTVCSHVGLVDKGLKYFEAMTEDFGITPTIEHYNCMVDLLGRAGQVDKAMEMVKTIPFQPPGKIWRTVLGACRKWRNVNLGREAFEYAVSLDKNDGAAYALMSSIYAAAHMWVDANEVEAMRIHAEAWKLPGRSWWTDTGGNVHAFVVRGQELLETQESYAELGE